MNPPSMHLLLAPLLAAVGACASPEAGSDLPAIAIEHVDVIPMDRERVLADQTVIVRGDRIEAIARDAAIPAGAVRVDGRGKWLIPGLADMHAHLLSDDRIDPSHAPLELSVMVANGVTTMRNPISPPHLLPLRERVARGEVVAPRMWLGSPQVAGRKLGGTFVGREVTNADEARAAVRDFHAQGYDFIKLTFFVSREAFDGAIEQARELDIRVIGHVGPLVGLDRALEVGLQIEHLDQYLEALVPDDAPFRESVSDTAVWRAKNWESLDWLDAGRIPALAERIVEAGVWSTPTMTFLQSSFATGRSDEEIEGSPDARFASPSVRENLLAGRPRYWANPPSEARRQRYVELRRAIVREIHRAGGKLMAGSDSPEWLLLYGFTLHRELEELAKSGLSPYATLETATRNPHEWLGDLREVGTIEVGKRADLVLLDANPLEDVRATTRIAAVCSKGRWMDRAELDRMLDDAARTLSQAPLLE